MRSRLSTVLSGVAGEYFVAAELSRRGYVASITLRNTRGIDILASSADATRTVAIQVKTRQDAGTDWLLNKKAETLPDDETVANLFYVFVALNGSEAPCYHIVPRSEVATFVTDSHAHWLSTPRRDGRAHLDTPIRQFSDPAGKYLGAWELLGLDAPAA